MLVWPGRQVGRLGEVSRGRCVVPLYWGNKRWARENPGSTLGACLPRGCWTPVCGSQTPAEMLPPDARRGAKRQLNIPLNLLFYCRNVPQQPLLAHQAERRERVWGQKGGVRVVRGSSSHYCLNTLDKMQQKLRQVVDECSFKIDWATHKVLLAKISVLVLLEFWRG